MGNKKHKKTGNKPVQSIPNDPVSNEKPIDFDEELEYALTILNRTDSWINSCDNKLSILVGVCGVVLTIFLTTDSINKAYDFLKEIIQNCKGANKYLFLIATIILLAFYCITCFHIVNAVVARIDGSKYKQDKMSNNSNLFFKSISEKEYIEFRNSFHGDTAQDKLNDVLTQVYINSAIATKKYEQYNKCLLWLVVSVLSTVGIVLWGVIGF